MRKFLCSMLLTTQLDADALLAQACGLREELIGVVAMQRFLRACIRWRGTLGLDGGQDALQADGKASSRLIASKGHKRGVVAPGRLQAKPALAARTP